MSISSTIQSINQVNREIATLEKSMADEMKEEADRRKKINDIKRSIDIDTSLSVLNSKTRQMDTYSNEIALILIKKTDINLKLADKKGKLKTFEIKLQKDQPEESKKLQKSYEENERRRVSEQKRTLAHTQNDINDLTNQLHANTLKSIQIKDDKNTQVVNEKYDVFIFHASEDKDSLVRKLAKKFKDDYQVNVWYDELSIAWGDSLRTAIDQGLANSKIGIVVISRPFIKKGWTNYELDGLFQIEMTNGKTILPIWHDITKDEVLEFSPSLAGKKALNTSTFTTDEIAHKLKKMLKKLDDDGNA